MAAPSQHELPPRLETAFADLQRYVQHLDRDGGATFVAQLALMSPAEVHEKLRGVQNFALKLGFEEAREMQRGRALNVFGSGAAAQASGGGSQGTQAPQQQASGSGGVSQSSGAQPSP
jgi:hypothetical protein